MKRFKLFFLTMFLYIGHVVYADIKNEYLSHCNISFGVSFKAGGDIIGSHGLNITLMDGFGDYYYFTYNPNENDDPMVGLNIVGSLPFYYNTYFSTGLFGQMIANGIFNDTSTMYFGGGLYAEGKYKDISLRSGIGISNIGIAKSIGKVKAAWPGDPGFYTGGEFVKPGESLIATTNLFQEISGITFNIELRYKLRRFFGVHIKLGYYFYPGIEINDYEIVLGKKRVESLGDDPSFTLNPVHNISILFGWGL